MVVCKETMRPISKDLRKRVIKYLDRNCNYAAAARKFEISEASARRWYLRYKETGSYAARPYPGKKPRLTEAEFTKYVNSHPGATLKQIGAYFKMTARSAHYYMKKFKFNYKKKSLAIWKPKQSNGKDT